MKIKLLTVLTLLLLFIISGCGDESGLTVNTNTTNTTTIPTPAPVGASTVQGTVYGTDGQPAGSGITVRLAPNVATVTGSENYGEQQTTTTDAQGGFSFTVHYTGAYLIDALNGTQLIGSQLFNVTGAGQVINIILGKVTGKLTVTVLPANAEASVTVTPGDGITTSSSPVTGSQTGEYIFYLPAGPYIVYAEATGYKPVDNQSVTITEGGEQALTFDFTTAGEVPVATGGIDPYSCINTGEVPVKYYVKDFTGTGTIEFIVRATGEVVRTVTVDESNLNSIDVPDTYYYSGGTYYYLSFTIDTTTMPTGLYNVKLTHTPPVIGGSSTTAEAEFYIADTIQTAVSVANVDLATIQEIITPWGNKFRVYTKVYIPAGTYQQGISPAFPDGNIEMAQECYLQGAGPDNTIIDFNTNSSYIDLASGGVIEGFTIKNGMDGCGAIWVTSSPNYIYNNKIENNLYGIFTHNSSSHYFFNNIITKSFYQGIYFGADTYGGIYVGNNVISENAGGIVIVNLQGSGSIIGNNIYNNNVTTGPGGGIYIGGYSGESGCCEIAGNVISGNSSTTNAGGGIFVYDNISGFDTGSVNIQNNEITKNTSATEGGGIYYTGQTLYSSVSGNNIYGNTSGVTTGNQLCVPSPSTPLLNADNNWWGAGVTIDDTEVFQVNTSVNIGTPATTQFPVPDVPAI